MPAATRASAAGLAAGVLEHGLVVVALTWYKNKHRDRDTNTRSVLAPATSSTVHDNTRGLKTQLHHRITATVRHKFATTATTTNQQVVNRLPRLPPAWFAARVPPPAPRRSTRRAGGGGPPPPESPPRAARSPRAPLGRLSPARLAWLRAAAYAALAAATAAVSDWLQDNGGATAAATPGVATVAATRAPADRATEVKGKVKSAMGWRSPAKWRAIGGHARALAATASDEDGSAAVAGREMLTDL